MRWTQRPPSRGTSPQEQIDVRITEPSTVCSWPLLDMGCCDGCSSSAQPLLAPTLIFVSPKTSHCATPLICVNLPGVCASTPPPLAFPLFQFLPNLHLSLATFISWTCWQPKMSDCLWVAESLPWLAMPLQQEQEEIQSKITQLRNFAFNLRAEGIQLF